MKPWFPALQLACNLGHLLTPTSALASSPLDPPPQETPRAPLGTRVGAGVSPRVPGAGWQRLRFEAVEPWIRTKQGSWQRPLGEAPQYRPWALGEGAVLGAGTEGPGRGRAPWDGACPDGPCQQGEAGALSTPSKEEPTPARLPKVPLAVGAHEAQARPGGP